MLLFRSFHHILLFVSVLGILVKAEDEGSPPPPVVPTTGQPGQDEATTAVPEEVTVVPSDAPANEPREEPALENVAPAQSEPQESSPEPVEPHHSGSSSSPTSTTTTTTIATTTTIDQIQNDSNHHPEGDFSHSTSTQMQHNEVQHFENQEHVHICSTQNPCTDPRSHCVATDQGNRCVCFLGYFMNETTGTCQSDDITTSTTTTTTTTTAPTTTTPTTTVQHHEDTSNVLTAIKRSDNEETQTTVTTEQTHQPSSTKLPHTKRKYAMTASSLSAKEAQAVVSLVLRPYTTVVEWLMENDLKFRSTVADIITSSNFTVHGENGSSAEIRTTVTADDVLYVSPSPQIYADGLLISFMVRDPSGSSSKEYLLSQGVKSRQRRDPPTMNQQTVEEQSGFLPASWVIPAIGANQSSMESLLGQNITSVYAGLSSELLSIERLASASLFERRMEVFVPVLILLAIVCIACVLSVVCARAKARSSATWDPPAGLVYTKGSRKENRDSVALSVCESGHDLASDAQCREGETDSINKQVIPISDDDVWVVPYSEPQGPKPQLWTEVQDTKL